jgi:hypothetical protein
MGRINRFVMQTVLIVLTISAPSRAFAEKPHQWETGTVVSQDLGSNPAGVYRGPLGGGQVVAPINLKSNIVVVQAGSYTYTWQEFTRSPNFHHFVVLVVNDQVRFYRDGDYFIVEDSKGSKHNFTMIGATKN